MIFKVTSESDTINVARDFAHMIKPRSIVLMEGDLGMGKSFFVRSVIRALTGDDALDVPSPTFTLLQTYDSPKGEIYHYDLYRLKDPDEIYEIGWEDALAHGITFVEWPDRLESLTPPHAIHIIIEENTESPAPTHRVIRIEGA